MAKQLAHNTDFALVGGQCRHKHLSIWKSLVPAHHLEFQKPTDAKPETVRKKNLVE